MRFELMRLPLFCTDDLGRDHLTDLIDRDCQTFIHRHLSTSDNITYPTRGIQHSITDVIDQLDFKYFCLKLERDESSADLPNYLSASAPGSATWYTTLPTNPRTTMSDFEYIVAICMRLNLEPNFCSELTLFSNDCSHCHKSDSHINDPWHMISCPSVQRFTTIRHNHMVTIAKQHFDMMDTHATQEPASLFPGSGLRPDIRVDVGDKVYLLDFCITHPSCPSNISAARDHPLGAADLAEKRKKAKYSTLATSIHAEFVPVIFETFGGVGKATQKFLDLMHRFTATNSFILSQSQIMGSLRASLACTLQKGNAMIAKQYLIRASQEDSDAYVAPSSQKPPRMSRKRMFILTQSATAVPKQPVARRSLSEVLNRVSV